LEIGLIYGILSSEFKESEIPKLVEGILKREARLGKPLEYVAGKGTLWMPYYRIRMEYWHSGKEPAMKLGRKVPAETALNAMFCASVNDESELLMIFRPNYLRHETVALTPTTGEVVGSASEAGVDFEGILSGLVKKKKEVEYELSRQRSTLSKNYVRKRRFSMLLPMSTLKEEKELSEKIAKLEALKNTISLCLNINEEVEGLRVLHHDIFHYPTSVFSLKNREKETQRFLIVNLVKAGAILPRPNCDILLTRLCERNETCKKLVAAAVAGSPLSS
jgi:hypothetical protein